MTYKQIINSFTDLLNDLIVQKEKSLNEADIEYLDSLIKEITYLRLCLKKGLIKNLSDFQKYSKWNYPAYFVMSYNTNVAGISLKDLREQHNNSFKDIISINKIVI